MSNTKRNTKKAPTESLQSDKAQGNTTVAPKTTRATKPSVAALQKEVESLKQQLVDSHQHVVRLKEEIQEGWGYYAELVSRPLSLIIYQRFADWLYNVTKNFRE